MKFKTLKHKTQDDVYGIIEMFGDKLEIFSSDVPDLQPMTATVELMKQYYQLQYPELVEILKDYELIVVELILSTDET